MAVIISELEHVPAPPEGRPRGGGGGEAGGGAAAAATADGLIQALRRESARRARLWAD